LVKIKGIVKKTTGKTYLEKQTPDGRDEKKMVKRNREGKTKGDFDNERNLK